MQPLLAHLLPASSACSCSCGRRMNSTVSSRCRAACTARQPYSMVQPASHDLRVKGGCWHSRKHREQTPSLRGSGSRVSGNGSKRQPAELIVCRAVKIHPPHLHHSGSFGCTQLQLPPLASLLLQPGVQRVYSCRGMDNGVKQDGRWEWATLCAGRHTSGTTQQSLECLAAALCRHMEV